MTVRRAKYIAQANFDDLLRGQRKATKGYGKMATAAEAASQSMSRSAGKTAAAQSALPLKAATAATAAERLVAARQSTVTGASAYARKKRGGYPVSYTHLTLPTNREV